MNKSHSPFKLLLHHLAKAKWIFLITVLLSIVLIVVGMVIPWIMKIVIDTYLSDQSLPPATRLSGFQLFMGYYIGLVFLQIGLRYLHGVLSTLIGMRIERDLRISAFDKINRLPLSFFIDTSEGQIVHRIETDSGGLRSYFNVMYALTESVISIIVVYATIIWIDWRLAIAIAIIVPIYGLWMKAFSALLNKFNERIRENNGLIKATINEIIYHVEMLQIINKQSFYLKRYSDAVTTTNQLQIKLGTSITLYGYELVLLFERTIQALALGYLSVLFVNGNLAITTGLIFTISTYIDKIVGPLHGVFNQLNALDDSQVATRRMQNFLALDEVPATHLLPAIKDLKKPIQFNNVTFGYTNEHQVLKDFIFNLVPGETVGIVGATGSGKSTLMNLLMRFYQPQLGNITIDGSDIALFDVTSYRQHLGIVLQSPSLFIGSLRDNLLLSEITVSDGELIDALEKVGLSYLLSRTHNGLDFHIETDGNNLSVGEKQLLAFARILLRHPDLVLLDEATANIDSATEQKIQQAVHLIAKNSTMLIIAHRLSTIRDANRIIVMDQGRIKAQGTHSELVMTSDLYRQMHEAQMKK